MSLDERIDDAFEQAERRIDALWQAAHGQVTVQTEPVTRRQTLHTAQFHRGVTAADRVAFAPSGIRLD